VKLFRERVPIVVSYGKEPIMKKEPVGEQKSFLAGFT
jgi:hypothetical protein